MPVAELTHEEIAEKAKELISKLDWEQHIQIDDLPAIYDQAAINLWITKTLKHGVRTLIIAHGMAMIDERNYVGENEMRRAFHYQHTGELD